MTTKTDPFPRHRLRCVDETKAAEILPHLHGAGYTEARQDGDTVEFWAHPNDAIHVVDFAHNAGYAHDADAANVIKKLPHGEGR